MRKQDFNFLEDVSISIQNLMNGLRQDGISICDVDFRSNDGCKVLLFGGIGILAKEYNKKAEAKFYDFLDGDDKYCTTLNIDGIRFVQYLKKEEVEEDENVVLL